MGYIENLAQHSCDSCGAERVPSAASCVVCGLEYTPWNYLSHEQAFQLLITLDMAAPSFVGGETTHVVTNYADDRAVIKVYSQDGHIGDI